MAIEVILAACASFAGATVAQILSHLFTLRRETISKQKAAENYILHLTFDIVSAVSNIESMLRGVGLLRGVENFRTPSLAPLNLSIPSDSYERLPFDPYVSPQFMLNTRKFFTQYTEVMQYVRSLEPNKPLSDFSVVCLATLYLQGLSYVVTVAKELKPRSRFRRAAKRIYINAPTYTEVKAIYGSDIGFALPDEKIFEAAKILTQNFERRAELN